MFNYIFKKIPKEYLIEYKENYHNEINKLIDEDNFMHMSVMIIPLTHFKDEDDISFFIIILFVNYLE